ncbi:Sec-independent protein translocase protein TatB [Achromobacter mucicolens]|uniref:Sec-independent protein translocase protein TatB n=1 Tax=Achromobacter mucicolens TaxID=1389922 RepID=UPI001465D625|nr:Sec-independent protein translocase protein TatB [Achromobacter mucicolens]MCP2514519.1 Sec-independent protein translocase protein TatB [Achromobacter mucicolens]WGJ90869.1 Sec-independent protein translocase protein TatB [Achromobacter mucicolens]CAB3867032.1 Sec-independent protein translocase protein TatB [Achromobacter mucicolens]
MFDVSLTELMVIGVVALIVIGPERLPKVARTVGHLLGRAQRYVNDVKSDIQREIELDELRKFKTEMEDAAQGVQQSLNETGASLQEPVQQFRAELDEVAREASGKAAPASPATATATQAPAADTPAEPARTIAPPSQNHNLDLDLPAAEPAPVPNADPRPAAPQQQPAPAPSATAADVAAPAAKPVSPSGTSS